MAEKKKNITYRTPLGTAVYPWLSKADTKFNADGEYRVKLRLSKEDAAEIIQMIDQLADQALSDAKDDIVKKAKNKKEEKEKLAKCVPADKPYKDVVDDDGNETGDIELNFKMKAIVKPKEGKPFKQQPKIFDAKGNEAPGLAVYGGSKIKVAFQLIPFFTPLVGAGASLRLVAVQVIELVSGGGTAESYGFEEEEGYEFDEKDSKQSSEEESVDCPDGNEKDF